MIRLPLRAPVAAGAKVTEKLQDEPAETVPPQLLTTEKSPLMEVPMPVSGSPPLLVSCTAMGADRALIVVFGKLTLVVVSVSEGPVIPVPVNCAVWVPRLSTSVSVPVAAPAATGAKEMVMAHAVFAANVLAQV